MTEMYYNPFYQQYQMNRNQGSALDENTASIVAETLQRERATLAMYEQVLEQQKNQSFEQDFAYIVQSKNQALAALDQIYQYFTGQQADVRLPETDLKENESIEVAYHRAMKNYEENCQNSMQVADPYSRQLIYQLAMMDYHIVNRLAGSLENDQEASPLSRVTDYGGRPFVIDIEDAAEANQNYRTALWTGDHLQVTLMSIPVGSDIGLEVHPDTDQFLRIEEGTGTVQMGNQSNNLTIQQRVEEDSAIMVPAGTWHNVTNTGNEPLKLYTIYAPPHHPFGTVERTKAEAMQEE